MPATRLRRADLLKVTWIREETRLTRYVGRGRGGVDRARREEVRVRYVITGIERQEVVIAARGRRLGLSASLYAMLDLNSS